MAQHPSTNRAVFLDRDGTLNRDIGFAHRPEQLELLEGAVAGLTRLQALGYQLFITTNQSGVARGYFTEAEMHAFNAVLCRTLAAGGVHIASVYSCVFHPTVGRGEYRRESPLRKPAPGMILQAASEHGIDRGASFVIGDRMSDVLAGQAAGCRTILLAPADQQADVAKRVPPDFIAANLLEAAAWIERVGQTSPGGLIATVANSMAARVLSSIPTGRLN